VCIRAARRFPLELEALAEEELAQHMDAAHKYCEFCDQYYYGAPWRVGGGGWG